MPKWNPARILWRKAEQVVAAAVAVVRAAQRVPHRGSTGPTGGSFPARMQAPDFIRRRGWGTNTRWATLGQPFMFFVDGTPHQKGHPIEALPPQGEVEAEIRADALRHFEEREARYGSE